MTKQSQTLREQLKDSVDTMKRSCPHPQSKPAAKAGERTMRLVQVSRSLDMSLERR
jgi:hypothetical protein